MLDLGQLAFTYDPFPIGLARSIFSEDKYLRLCRTFPSKEFFISQPVLGNRMGFSPQTNRSGFRYFLKQNQEWRDFYRWVKGAFERDLLTELARHEIDLGYVTTRVNGRERALNYLRNVKRGRFLSPRLSTELIFSMLPADGGFPLPHTDSTRKVCNVVLSMIGPEGWDPEVGGGTDINWPKDRRLSFNRNNRRLPFDQVDVLDTIPFRANQAVVVIKTYNSWHSVAPLSGKDSSIIRKTVNINLITN